MTPDQKVGRSDDTQENLPPDYIAPRQKGRGKGDWHDKARQMRAEGLRYADIARAFNVTPCAVYFVINPNKRWVPHGKRNGAAPAVG